MRKGTKRLITPDFCSVACTVLTFAQDADEQRILTYFHSISSEEITGWMTEICSRNTTAVAGTPEYIAAAEWFAGKISEWDIKPR